MLIPDMSALEEYLAQCQLRCVTDVRCELTPALSARVNDAVLVEALVTGLPMAQGIQQRIVRNRGKAIILTAKFRYRQGIRMLRGTSLTAEESAGLETAQSIAEGANRLFDEEDRFRLVYDWICRNIRYAHMSPGQKGYERLVGAASVLEDHQANCQGFADVLYLLCGLCGIVCEYRCGRGEKRLHVWNAVRLKGAWREADVSKGARCIAD